MTAATAAGLVVLILGTGFYVAGEPAGVVQLAQAQPAGDRSVNGGDHPFARRIAAPSLEGGEWVNTPRPLGLDHFRGRFVLLDFWTYCCINCMHVLPELAKLEHAYPNELVVVGIHSAKFEGEQVTENIREAAERYEIEHPVVNDAEMAIWQRYGARSWPTLVLIDPAGEVVWAASGERTFEDIKAVIDRGLPYYQAKGLLKPAPRPEIVRSARSSHGPLRFPGKVLVDEAGGRLFIADSGHNRIVIAGLDGKVREVIGSGAAGRADGKFAECSFNHPQGMALVDDVLYVADTENHLLRKADLATKQVATIAGTGERGAAQFRIADTGVRNKEANPQWSPARIALASPWALWPDGDALYIAMAGTHQIWRIWPDENRIEAYAGNGREDISDGPLLPEVAYRPGFSAFAQPSGLTSNGTHLFVADSEGSTVRSVPLDAAGEVETLVGLTGTLFDFGDQDGVGREVRLQHPLGLAWWDGKLYVADTYNNKVKVIDVAARSCQTIAGTGEAGSDDAADGARATFNEPGGLWAAGGKLYVADTNNHAIRVVQLAAPYGVTTLAVDRATEE